MRARLARPHLQDYFNRNYIAGHFDEGVFDALNTGAGCDGSFVHAIGCLDALDEIPAGSMVSRGNGAIFDRSLCERGLDLIDLQRMEAATEELLQEFL